MRGPKARVRGVTGKAQWKGQRIRGWYSSMEVKEALSKEERSKSVAEKVLRMWRQVERVGIEDRKKRRGRRS